MATVKLTIKGKSPLLMHRYPLIPIGAIEKKSQEEQAEYAAYRDPDTGKLYMPADAVYRSLVNAATYSKGKGRASLQKPVASCVIINPERIPLGVEKYAIDSRRVVVPATRGSVIRHRPRLDEWSCSFELDYDETLLTEGEIRKVVDDDGQRVGLLDFRPACKGPMGRFFVVAWKLLK